MATIDNYSYDYSTFVISGEKFYHSYVNELYQAGKTDKPLSRTPMKITDNLTKQEIIQELDWRATTTAEMSTDEILVVIKVLSDDMKTNPNGYGEKDAAAREAELKDILEVIVHNLKNFWMRILDKHTFTHESIVKAIKHLAETLECGDQPTWSTMDSFLVRQEGSIYTIEDLEAAATRAFKEGYQAAVKDTSTIEKSGREPNIILT